MGAFWPRVAWCIPTIILLISALGFWHSKSVVDNYASYLAKLEVRLGGKGRGWEAARESKANASSAAWKLGTVWSFIFVCSVAFAAYGWFNLPV
jgi:hypothetical protein